MVDTATVRSTSSERGQDLNGGRGGGWETVHLLSQVTPWAPFLPSGRVPSLAVAVPNPTAHPASVREGEGRQMAWELAVVGGPRGLALRAGTGHTHGSDIGGVGPFSA